MNDLTLDDEIHRLISLLLKQHVRPWYNNITQDEQLFAAFERLVNDVNLRLAGRVQGVDWENFVLHRIFEVILVHLEDFNRAAERRNSSQSLEAVFLAKEEHLGIHDEQAYLSLVVDGLLTILLPSEELVSEVAYGFTRELLADLILADLIDRLCEPWFWDELVQKLMRRRTGPGAGAGLLNSAKSILSWFSPPSSINQSLYDTAIPKIIAQLAVPSRYLFKHVFIDYILPSADLFFGHHWLSKLRDALRRDLTKSSMARIVAFTRMILFPDDLPSPARVVPTEVEQSELRHFVEEQCPVPFPWFRNKAINKVLLFKIMDCVLGTIFPELKIRSPQQLKEKAIAILDADREAGGAGGISTGKANNTPTKDEGHVIRPLLSIV